MNKDAKSIVPPNKLADKTKYGGAFAVSEAVLEKAEQQIQNLTGEYLLEAIKDVHKLEEIFLELKAEISEYDKHAQKLFVVAHEIKGKGGTFGYELTTNIADQMCGFLEGFSETPDDFTLKIIELYISSLATINTNELSGDGGENGKNLLAGLDAIHSKWRESHTDG